MKTSVPNSCLFNPCGFNSICQKQNNIGTCVCQPYYFGDPYVGCRPECVIISDCPRNRICSKNRCLNPCVGACGLNADCVVINHIPICLCISGFTGNPFILCEEIVEGLNFVITCRFFAIVSYAVNLLLKDCGEFYY